MISFRAAKVAKLQKLYQIIKILGCKTAKVVPIHKKGNVINVSNYRPISLLCLMSKILEKLVYN